MHWGGKTLTLVLLTAVAASAAMPQMMLAQPAPQTHPAHCHESGGSSGPASPVSYQCCQTGHYSAIVQASSELAIAMTTFAHSQQLPSPSASFEKTQSPFAFVSSGGPPLSTSLRI